MWPIDQIKQFVSGIEDKIDTVENGITTALGNADYSATMVKKYYNNYEQNNADHKGPANRASELMDSVGSHGMSVKTLESSLHLKLTEDAPAPHEKPAGKTRAHCDEVASDVMIDMALVNTLAPKAASAKAAYDNVGSDIVSYNQDLSIITVDDPYSGQVRAFKRVAEYRDMTTPEAPKPNSTGLCVAGYAELNVTPEMLEQAHLPNTPVGMSKYIARTENVEFKAGAEARVVVQGYHPEFEKSAGSGQQERGEMPNPLARVNDAIDRMQEGMKAAGLPADTHIGVSGHSTGAAVSLAIAQRWEENPRFKEFGEVTRKNVTESVGESQAVRTIAVMNAAAKSIKGEDTSVEAEIDKLKKGVRVVENSYDVNNRDVKNHTHNYVLGGDKRNNLPIGEELYKLPGDMSAYAKAELYTEAFSQLPSTGAAGYLALPALTVISTTAKGADKVLHATEDLAKFGDHTSPGLLKLLHARGKANEQGVIETDLATISSHDLAVMAPSAEKPKEERSGLDSAIVHGGNAFLSVMQTFKKEWMPWNRGDEHHMATALRATGEAAGLTKEQQDALVSSAEQPGKHLEEKAKPISMRTGPVQPEPEQPHHGLTAGANGSGKTIASR